MIILKKIWKKLKYWQRGGLNMIKLKELIHTLLHFILGTFFITFLIFNTDTSYYEGWSSSEARINDIRFFTFILFLYLSTGLLFDYVINFLSKNKSKNLMVYRVIFITAVTIFSLWLFWIIYVLSGWTGEI